MTNALKLPEITVIIPTRNMAQHVLTLLKDIYALSPQPFSDILIVDDASSDESIQQLQAFQKTLPENQKPKLHIAPLSKNFGRFGARYYGAQQSHTEKIVFLDSRVRLGKNFAKDFVQLPFEEKYLMALVDIDTEKSLFSLYWDKSHRFIFARHYKATRQAFYLTAENYDSYLKGSTALLCDRKSFLDSCATFATPPRNDDTALMKVMVKQAPILIHPLFRILWQPRLQLGSFLARLWERGPSFVEYHGYNLKSPFFAVIWLFAFSTFAFLGCCLLEPLWGCYLLIGSLVTIVVSSGLLSKNIKEIILLAPLHTLVVLTSLAGICYGILSVAFDSLRALAKNSYHHFLGNGSKPANLP